MNKHIINWKQFFESFEENPFIYDNPKFVKMIEESIEKDGTSLICTFVASAVKMLEGDNVKIYGFNSEENPESEYFFDDEEGHNFAVMNNRYIIDPWIYNNYENYEIEKTFDRSVFDLQNKNDEKIIRYLYGDENNWVDITNRIDNFKDIFPNTYEELLNYYKNL